MALNGLTGSAGLNFNNVNNTIYEGIRSQETNLQTTIAKLGSQADGNISQTDMLMMQQQVTQWSMMIEIQSTITKQIGDSLKGVIQKAS
jgi:type III secretion protein F